MASATVGILRALLSANVAEFETDMKRAGRAVHGLTNDFKAIGTQATQLGATMTKVLTVPILGVATAASKFAIDFESSFAGVRKTVDATDAEFAEMAQGFRDLAKTIPINVNELNRLGEAAGALGIPKAAIVDFARVMGLLGETTNLTADQAAESIAKIQNIFGAAGKDTERFASTLVALGNDGASTEEQIVSMATRIAGAGNAIGLTQGQVLAFASALSSVGLEAEAGGSAISRVFLDIATAVSQGGDALSDFAKVAGVSVDQFSQRFKDDAAGAVTAFIAGLSQIKESGGDLIGTLEKLGFTEIRVRDTLLRAAGAGNLLTEALNLQARAWRENSALTIEAGKRFETTASQLVLLWNRLKDVGITLGNALLPLIKSTIGVFDDLIPVLERITTGFEKLPVGMQASIIGLFGLAAAAGPALFIFGQLSFAASQVTGMFTAKGLAMKALIPLFRALTGPIGLTVAAILGGAGLVAAIAAATGKWDALMSTLKGAGSVLVESARLLADLVSLGLKPLIESAKFTFDWIGKLKGVIDSSLVPSLDAARRASEENAFALAKTGIAAQQAGGFFENLARGIRAWRDALNGVKPPLVDVGGRIGGLVTSARGLNTGFQQVATQGAAQLRTALTGTNTAAKKLKEAIEDLRDELSGAKLQGDVNKLVGALRLLTPAQRASEDVTKRLVEAVGKLGIAYDKLPPSLQRVAFETQKVTDGIAQLIPKGEALPPIFNDVEKRARAANPILREFGIIIGRNTPIIDLNKKAIDDWILSLEKIVEAPPRIDRIRQAFDQLGQQLDGLARAFAQMADVADGALSALFADIARVITAMDAAHKSADSLKIGLGQLSEGNIAGGLASIVTGALGTAAAFDQATSSMSRWKNAAGGAATGAITGAAIGSIVPVIGTAIGAGIGALVGGIAGALRGRKEWFKIGQDIGRDFGLGISEELAKEIEKTSKIIGDRFAATLLHLPDLIRAAGGAKAFGLDQAVQASRDLFSQLDRGLLSTRDVANTLGQVFPELAKDILTASDSAFEGFRSLIDVTRAHGLEVEALDQAIVAMAADVATMSDDAFGRYVKIVQAAGAETEGLRDALEGGLLKALGDLVGAAAGGPVVFSASLKEMIGRLKEAGQATEELTALMAGEQQKTISGLADLIGNVQVGEGMDIGGIAGAFSAILGSGADINELFKAIGPGLDGLIKRMKDAGLEGTTAFQTIANMAGMAGNEISNNAVVAAQGAINILTGLANQGLATEEVFDAMTAQVFASFKAMESQGQGGTQALRRLQPQLQAIWELQKEQNFTVDEGTQLLLDQAAAAGLVGDAHRSAAQRSVNALESILARFDLLLQALGVDIPAAAEDTKDAIEEGAQDGENEWHTMIDAVSGDMREKMPDAAKDASRDAGNEIERFFQNFHPPVVRIPIEWTAPPFPTLPSPSAPPGPSGQALSAGSAFSRGFELSPNVASSAVTVHQYVTIEGMIDSDNLRRIHDEHLLPLQEDAIMFNRGPQGLRTVIRKHTR